MATTTPGMVCAHHHLYSTLARGMPAPPRQPTRFGEILEQVWWRLDTALDLDMIRASALLGATEALMSGTTAIIDHHESPNAIEGSLDVIADACAEQSAGTNHVEVERGVEPPPHLLEDLPEPRRLARGNRHAPRERRIEVVMGAHQARGRVAHDPHTTWQRDHTIFRTI